MRISAQKTTVELLKTFAISRSARDRQELVELQIEHEGIYGFGECAPVDFWQESTDSALEFLLEQAEEIVGCDPFALEEIAERMAERSGQQGAKRAIDAALYDWIGKRLGQPTWRLLGLKPFGPPTSYTVAIDTVEGTVATARACEGFAVLKLKVGSEDDLDRLQALRQNTAAAIRVDANEGWTLETASRLMPQLAQLQVELVEQPFPAHDLDSYKQLKQKFADVPVIVDEGCKDLSTVSEVATYADGINIKLAKSGGLREAIRMVHAARALGLRVMLGCMIESQLGIAHAAQIASLADYIDLDGHLLIADSPFVGLGFSKGRVLASSAPGLGVEPQG
jgi:L-Ala-D/L-Glu epimerase